MKFGQYSGDKMIKRMTTFPNIVECVVKFAVVGDMNQT